MRGKRTIVKVLPKDNYYATAQDVERWRGILNNKEMTIEEAVSTGEVEATSHPIPDDNGEYITLVKIGSDEYSPSMEDLEIWREMFAELKNDSNPVIFTAVDVEVDVIHIGKILKVE